MMQQLSVVVQQSSAVCISRTLQTYGSLDDEQCCSCIDFAQQSINYSLCEACLRGNCSFKRQLRKKTKMELAKSGSTVQEPINQRRKGIETFVVICN